MHLIVICHNWLLRSVAQTKALILIVVLLECRGAQLQRESLVILSSSDKGADILSQQQKLEWTGSQLWLYHDAIVETDEVLSLQVSDITRLLLRWRRSNDKENSEEWHVSVQQFHRKDGVQQSVRASTTCDILAALHILNCSRLEENLHPNQFASCSCEVLKTVSESHLAGSFPDCLHHESALPKIKSKVDNQACFSGWWISNKGPVWMHVSSGWFSVIPPLSSWCTGSFTQWESRWSFVEVEISSSFNGHIKLHMYKEVELKAQSETGLQCTVPQSSSLRQLHTAVQNGKHITSAQHWFAQGDQVHNQRKSSCERDVPLTQTELLKWHVRGTGLHRQLAISIDYQAVVAGEEKCLPLLALHLPTGVYVDVDELQNLALQNKLKVHTFDNIDIERPAFESPQHMVLVASTNHSSSQWMQLSVPFHLRYQMPNYNQSHHCTYLQPPQLLLECPAGSSISGELPCLLHPAKKCVLKSVNSIRNETLLPLCLPVGQRELEELVLWVTISVTGVACAYLMWLIGTLSISKEHAD